MTGLTSTRYIKARRGPQIGKEKPIGSTPRESWNSRFFNAVLITWVSAAFIFGMALALRGGGKLCWHNALEANQLDPGPVVVIRW